MQGVGFVVWGWKCRDGGRVLGVGGWGLGMKGGRSGVEGVGCEVGGWGVGVLGTGNWA
jgi:hypothetical protein